MRLLLQLVRKITSATHDGGMDEWVGNCSIRDMISTMMIVELFDESSTKQDLAICEGKRTYPGETLGKPRGFGLRYVGAISPLIRI